MAYINATRKEMEDKYDTIRKYTNCKRFNRYTWVMMLACFSAGLHLSQFIPQTDILFYAFLGTQSVVWIWLVSNTITLIKQNKKFSEEMKEWEDEIDEAKKELRKTFAEIDNESK